MHGLGSRAMDKHESLDFSNTPNEVKIPELDKSHSRIGDIRKVNKEYQVPLFLDSSGRKHKIESHVEDMRGNIVRTLPASSTVSELAELSWDHTDNHGHQVKEGMYTWYIKADEMLHSVTVNDNLV
jgi:flagellar hook assembly protein FlgD